MRVLVVDDHAGFRAAARTLLEADGFEVVGEAVDGASALAQVVALRPDLVLLDVQLPDMDGFAVTEQIARRVRDGEVAWSPAVVLTSTRERSSFRHRLAGSPARGFVAKDALTGAAIRAVVDGER